MSAIARQIAGLFDVAVVVEAARPELRLEELLAEERQYIESAAPKRQAEFATARLCARRAFARLGIDPCPLVPERDRAPRWTSGVVGSISHTSGLCAVVVTEATAVASVGVDVESATPIESDLEPMICTPPECRWLDRLDQQDRGRWVKLLFSAKEAFYKCQYPVTGMVLDFRDIELAFDVDRSAFAARRAQAGPTALDRWTRSRGRWAWSNDFVLTGYALG